MLGVAVGGEQDYVAQHVQNEAGGDHRCVSDDVRQCAQPSQPHVCHTYSPVIIGVCQMMYGNVLSLPNHMYVTRIHR